MTFHSTKGFRRDAPIIVDIASRLVCEDTRSPVLSCKCGRSHLADAALRARRDPTRTLDLRRKFIRSLEKRWKRVSRLVTEAVATQDMFGLNVANAHALQIVAMSSGRVPAFQQWIDAALADTILGMDREQWVGAYIREAYQRGWTAATLQVGRDLPLNIDRADIITKLTIAELQGVIEAFSQRAVRAFSDGLMSHLPPATIARAIRKEADKVGIVRSRMTVQTMIVRANGEAALDAFQSAGHTHVDVLPETMPSPGRMHAIRDAKARSRRSRRRGVRSEFVEVLTAGDDDVCIICQDISEGGPYAIADARGLIPAHPNCRCAFVPAYDARFAHGDAIIIVDAFDPNEPRNARGEWTAEETIEMAKTQRELLAAIRAKKAGEQRGEAFINIPSNAQKIRNAEIMFGTGSPQHKAAIKKFSTKDEEETITLTHGYRVVRGNSLKIGQIFRDPNEAKLARDVQSLDAGEGSQVWEVDVSGIETAEADDIAVYLPAGTSFEVVGFDQSRGVWNIDARDAFDPNEPRDPDGKWTELAGGSYTGNHAREGMQKAGLVRDNPLPRSQHLDFSDLEKHPFDFTAPFEDGTMKVADLKTVQDYVAPDQVGLYMKPKEDRPSGMELGPLAVVEVGKEKIVINGTHRLLAAHFNGEKDIAVRNYGRYTVKEGKLTRVDAR